MDSISFYSYEGRNDIRDLYFDRLKNSSFQNRTTTNFINNFLLSEKIEKGEFSSANFHLQQAFQNINDVRLNSYNKAKTLNVIGQYYLKKEDINSAQNYFNKALSLLTHNDSLSLLSRAIILNNIGVCFDKNDKLTQAETFYRKSLETFREAKLQESIASVEAMNNLAGILRYRGSLHEAIYWIEQALDINKKYKKTTQRFLLLDALAAANRTLGNYEYALSLYENCNNYFKKTLDNENEARTKIGMAITYINKGDYTLSDSILSKLQHQKLSAYNALKWQETAHYLAQEKGDYTTSIQYLKNLSNLNSEEKYNYYGEIADNYLSLKDTSAAAFWANESENEFVKSKQLPDDLWLTTLFVKAKISNNQDEIIEVLKKAESIAVLDLKSNYDEKNVIHPIGFLETKKIFFSLIKEHKLNIEEADFENEVSKVYDYISLVQQTIVNDAETIDFINISKALTDLVIDINFEKYNLTKNEKYINEIIKWNENRKAIVLRKNIKKAIYSTSKNEGKSLLEAEIFELKTKENNDSIKAIIAEKQVQLHQLNEKNNSIIAFKNFFENPGIFKAMIPEKTSILYNLSTENHRLIIICNSDKLHIMSSPHLKILSSDIDALQSTSVSTFTAASYRLYNILFRAIEPFLQANVVIIPDEKTEKIPYEVLVKSNHVMPFKMLDYLNKHYAFGYNYSVSNYLDAYTVAGNNSTVAYFAPIDFTSFANLQGSKDELEAIRREIQVNPFLKAESTIQNFQNSKYNFIHLSAHSVVDAYLPEMSYVQMFHDSKHDGKLYVKDIYNLSMNKDLLYLASCKNAEGQYKSFEGNISVARAFIQAGFHNVMATLWEISDADAGMISGKFYKYLKKENSKLIAMQKARNEYLEKASEIKAAPKFWGSYRFIVNKNEIRIHKGFSSVLHFLIIIAVPVILFFAIQIFPNKE